MRADDAPPPQDSVLATALAGPMSSVEQIVFARRLGYDDPHWYANIGYFCDDENHKAYPGGGKPDVGQLCLLDVRSGKVTVLLDAQGGSVRDPDVYYDAEKILFSYRKADSDYYNLYEINLDGTGLRQLTTGPFDDYEPVYLPDGGILFVSTRCQCWVNCWMTQVGSLYRCDGDGGNIQRVSHNPEHDNTPAVLPDGRILYTRWEYVDRSQVEFHHLWTKNPDGSGEMTFYGNMHPGVVMIDAKPIPNSDDVLVSFSPGHGVTDHQGHVAIVSPQEGPDIQPTARQLTHKWPLFKDPYPLSQDCFIVAQENRILVMDGNGKTEPLYQQQGPGLLHEPRPVIRRRASGLSRLAWMRDKKTVVWSSPMCTRAGTWKESSAATSRSCWCWNCSPNRSTSAADPTWSRGSAPSPSSECSGRFLWRMTVRRISRCPPAAPCSSWHSTKTTGRCKRMHSWVSVMPGETTSCVGCHEPRNITPPPRSTPALEALQRPPHRITPFDGQPDVIDFPRDIQPILDRHCVECHNYQRRDGGVLLTGDLGAQWSHSFFHLFAHLQVADGRNGLGNYPPRTIGSAASPLLDKLETSHYDVSVSPEEWRTVWLWIESGAPYAGSYAGLRNAEDQQIDNRAAGWVFGANGNVLKRRCAECHAIGKPTEEQGRAIPFAPNVANNARGLKRRIGIHERVVLEHDPLAKFSYHILVNLTRPEFSPLILGPLAKEAGGWESCGAVFADKSDPDYQRLLASIQQGKAHADQRPRYGTPGFRPNRQYIRELKRVRCAGCRIRPGTLADRHLSG